MSSVNREASIENLSNEGSTRNKRDVQRGEDQPSDFTLVASEGKEFRVHRSVLSEASVFFQKLLSSDMMESKQGVVRLDMLTETFMEDVLQFIYTGSVQITAAEKAEDLVMAADYLCLPLLKTFAGKFLEERLSTSNCVSTYYFAENYLCEDLVAKTAEFIHANFVAVANENEFLRLSSEEVEKWISSDKIVLNSEEDVFEIIIKWIEQDRNGRKINFANLFRHVRLIFVTRDYLFNDIVTNQLVKDLEDDPCLHHLRGSLHYVVQAIHSDLPWPQTPRRTLEEEDGIVAFEENQTLLYLPQKDKWFQLPDTVSPSSEMVTCQGKIYNFSYEVYERYDSLVNSWAPVSCPFTPTSNTFCHAIVVRADIYLLLRNLSRNGFVLWKYNTALMSWQPVPSCHWRGKEDACIVVLDKDIYTVGGFDAGGILTEARRYDTTDNTWTEIADIQEGRRMAFGAFFKEKLYVAGGLTLHGDEELNICEMYDISSNQWQFIASLTVPRFDGAMLCVNDTLYVVGGFYCDYELALGIESYDVEKNEWVVKAVIPQSKHEIVRKECTMFFKACPVRLFKRVIDKLQPL